MRERPRELPAGLTERELEVLLVRGESNQKIAQDLGISAKTVGHHHLPQAPQKRKQHGSKGSTVFRDPNEDDRVWVLFDWDAEGWQSFVSDPEVPAILQEAGHKVKPQAAELGGQYDA